MKAKGRIMNYLYALRQHSLHGARDENGQTLVEYSLIILLMSIALVGTLTAFGGGVNGLYGVIQGAIDALGG